MTEENAIDRERLRAAAIDVRTNVSDKLGSIWWLFLLRGLFAIGLGISALFWPSLSLSVLFSGVGIYCLCDGIAGLDGALRHPESASTPPRR